MKKSILGLLISLVPLNYSFINCTRSVHRPQDPTMPQISARWEGDTKHYTLKESHLEEYPIFKIRAEDSYKYFLPKGAISFRDNPEQSVEAEHLKKLIEELLVEIQEGKSSYTHFKALRKWTGREFNLRKKCGLLILKFKDYPFVLKLSMEKPDTFVNPYCKGFVPRFFFFLSGGTNRHMTGLTRVLNLEMVNKRIRNHPYWSSYVQMPRKWFWLPENTRWIEIIGKNIGRTKTIMTKLPSVYAVIADEIDTNQQVTLSQKVKNQNIIRLCNDLDLIIDPQKDNFIFQKDPKTQKISIVIIDTEHFPTIVGFKEKYTFRNNLDYYVRLANKCFNDMFLRTKQQRREAQLKYSDLALF